MSQRQRTGSPGPDAIGHLLDRARAWGEEPVVNPRRGRLPGVTPLGKSARDAALLALATFAVLVAATIVQVVFGDASGGFIYANF